MPVFLPTPMPTPVFCLGSFTILLFYYLPVFVSYLESPTVLLSYRLPVPIFYPESSTVLLSYCVPALISCSVSSSVLLSCYAPVFYCKISAFLLPLPVLAAPISLKSSPLSKFKQFLLNKP